MQFSQFAQHYSSRAGIVQLMRDLAPRSGQHEVICQLGGGNPARIPELERLFNELISDSLDDCQKIYDLFGKYDHPQGNLEFREYLSEYLISKFNWPLTADHIAITNGSQSSFEILFNAFGGIYPRDGFRHVLLPMIPDYIGYGDLSRQGKQLLFSRAAKIEKTNPQRFKYRLNTDDLPESVKLGAACISRPTNPTGNVITDEELAALSKLCRSQNIPLIIDGAYGPPFPNIIFSSATAYWCSNTILCLSLSKLGLPGVRTGIVIGDPEVTELIRNANAINGLAPSAFGPTLMTRLLQSQNIAALCEEVIKPHYLIKRNAALSKLTELLTEYPVRIHEPEGAMFLWIWMENLPTTAQYIYEEACSECVFVVPGQHAFNGLRGAWSHGTQCIRLSYAGESAEVEDGIDRLCRVIKRSYDGANEKR